MGAGNPASWQGDLEDMAGDHPDPQLLERFMRNEADARERRVIVRHLLAGCPRCTAVTGRLWSFGEARPDRMAVRRAGRLELKARLAAERDRLEEAECLLGQALALYRSLGERHLEGRVLILAAVVRSRAGGEAAQEAIGRLRQGLARLEEEREPALAAAACHRLALLLAETGREQDALAPLRRARSLYERLEDGANGPNLARLRHLEGVIAAALDAPEEAETALREGMGELLRAGLGAEAARALLDLALLYTRQGRAADVRRLAEGFYPICQVRGVGLSVVTALLFFRRLVETGHATPEVLFQVARFLADPPRAQRPALW